MTYETINPTTGKSIQVFPEISDAELERVLATAQHAYEQDWRSRSIQERKKVLSAAAALLRSKADEYAHYVTLEMGKLKNEARGEVGLSAKILDYYAQHAEAFLKPRALTQSAGAELHLQPIGILLAVEPWNFPYYQIARVVGPQLMVGNVVVLKHAENVPQCALAFERLLEEAGAPKGVYTNIFANIDQVGRVIEDERVRGVTVTGSERAGAAIAERAGRNLKKCVMELGGSDPLIVLEDADLESALNGAVRSRMVTTGQCCIGAKRIIVVGKERGEKFQADFIARLAALKAGDPAEITTQLGPLSSKKALDLLLQQIEDAKQGGAGILLGGKQIDRPGFYLEATVLGGISETNPVYRQELFGPVASFYIVESEAQAILLANATPFGLGASVFTADLDRGRRVANEIDSGMVYINQAVWTAAELPFGGVKRSGFGRELSELGFNEFVNQKLINVAPSGAAPSGARCSPVKKRDLHTAVAAVNTASLTSLCAYRLVLQAFGSIGLLTRNRR